jgi:hypothetical protein
MFQGLRGLGIVAALCGGMLAAAPAQAQETVSFRGVDFSKPDGWCLKRTRQGENVALEFRHCGDDYPYLSVTILDSSHATADWDIPQMAENFAALMEGPQGGSTFASAVADAYGAC